MSTPNPATKPLKQQPKNSARRSKEERDERARQENERKKAQQDAFAAEERAEAATQRGRYGFPIRESRRGRGPGAPPSTRGRGGRGGFMGQSPSHPPSVETARGASSGRAVGRARRGASSVRGKSVPSGGEQVVVQKKIDPVVKRDEDEDGDVAMLDAAPVNDRDEDGGYISSDAEDGSKRNIDFINLSSDDMFEDADDANGVTKRTLKRRSNGMLPVRLQRREHVERSIAINSEASSAMSAELQRTSDDGRGELSFSDTLASAAKKGKVKSKDVELLDRPRQWRGVYQNEGDEDVFYIKNEQNYTNELSEVLDTQARASRNRGNPAEESTQDQATSSDPDETRRSSSKGRRIKQPEPTKGKEPMFQTEEEKREWRIHKNKLHAMRQELGTIHLGGEGDSGASTASRMQQQVRNDTIYLFQMPPVLPNLRPATDLEHGDSTASAAKGSAAKSAAIVKTEDGVVGLSAPGTNDSGSAASLDVPQLAPGRMGKLRIHESGRATLTWGGTTLEMSPGINPDFPQTAVLVKQPGAESVEQAASSTRKGKQRAGIDVGEAICFGQIRGKMVVMPDWEHLLG